MADKFQCSSESCLVHKEVLAKIAALEKDMDYMKEQLEGKVDKDVFDEIITRKKQKIDDIKTELTRLNASDVSTREALAGIHIILDEFKQIHQEMKEDYKKLVETQVETQKNIAVMASILERQEKLLEKKVEDKPEEDKSPWYVKIFHKNQWLSMALFALVIFIIIMVASHWPDIVGILTTWLSGGKS